MEHHMKYYCIILAVGICIALGAQLPSQEKKDAKTVTIDAKIAPRKLAHLKEIYPLEVIACWPHPKGKKAHETIVTIDAKPSAVHKALVDFGLKPGTPVMGEGKELPQGPEV